MKEPDQDELWDLLRKKPKVTISPFFSRNVVREARNTKQSRNVGEVQWNIWKVLPLTASFAVAMIVSVYIFALISTHPESHLSSATAQDASLDFEAITNLDQWISNEENTVWVDTSHF